LRLSGMRAEHEPIDSIVLTTCSRALAVAAAAASLSGCWMQAAPPRSPPRSPNASTKLRTAETELTNCGPAWRLVQGEFPADHAPDRASATRSSRQTRLAETFKALASDALAPAHTRFSSSPARPFGKLHQQSADELGKRHAGIDTWSSRSRRPGASGRQDRRNRKSRTSAYSPVGTAPIARLAQTSLQTEHPALHSSARQDAGTWGELQLRAWSNWRHGRTLAISPNRPVRRLRPTRGELPRGQRIVVDARPHHAIAKTAGPATRSCGRTSWRTCGQSARPSRARRRSLWSNLRFPGICRAVLPGDQFLAAPGSHPAHDRAIAPVLLPRLNLIRFSTHPPMAGAGGVSQTPRKSTAGRHLRPHRQHTSNI